jgi:hypothetical protein
MNPTLAAPFRNVANQVASDVAGALTGIIDLGMVASGEWHLEHVEGVYVVLA